jgi:hypothetical protein
VHHSKLGRPTSVVGHLSPSQWAYPAGMTTAGPPSITDSLGMPCCMNGPEQVQQSVDGLVSVESGGTEKAPKKTANRDEGGCVTNILTTKRNRYVIHRIVGCRIGVIITIY